MLPRMKSTRFAVAPSTPVVSTRSSPASAFPRCYPSHSAEITANTGQERKWPVEFVSFDCEYVQKLTEGDPVVEQHFVSYFEGLLLVKLRFRLRSTQDVEDLRQEVFLRVLRTLRQGNGVQQPERFGAFVNSVCNNLIFEYFRMKGHASQSDEFVDDRKDPGVDLERDLITQESHQAVRTMIAELSPRDRNILTAVWLDERDKNDVCRELGVDRSYLRVLLHRARNRFRVLVVGQRPGS
jgi:RNA polymerase sigma-70 factor (ECF subfamily)